MAWVMLPTFSKRPKRAKRANLVILMVLDSRGRPFEALAPRKIWWNYSGHINSKDIKSIVNSEGNEKL